MGKAKSCTSEEREIILNLRKENYSYAEIAKKLKRSKKLVFDALKHWDFYKTVNNVPRKKRPRKTSAATDRKIIRLSKQDPLKSAVDIRKEVFSEEVTTVSVRTVQRRLVEHNLHGRVAREKPLLSKRNRLARLKFASEHINWTSKDWKRILWSDETKINRIGSDGRKYCRRPPGKEFDHKYTKPVVKFGGGSIMLWGCFGWSGVGPIYRVEGKMDQNQYLHILENVMEPYAEENLPVTWKYQQDNDPKIQLRGLKSGSSQKVWKYWNGHHAVQT